MKTFSKGLIAWVFYDWANSSYSAIIMTFVFPAYFVKRIAAQPEEGVAIWGWTLSLAGLLIALLSPLLGSIADYAGQPKRWIAGFMLLNVLTTALLWFIQPGVSETYALLLFALGTIGAECAFIFYNAMLPELSPQGQIGRWSGWGWGSGYLGGMTALTLSLVLFVDPSLSPFNLNLASYEGVRATFLLVAAWHTLFALPFFFLTPQSTKKLPLLKACKTGFQELKGIYRRLQQFPTLIRFFIARLFFIDGLTTLFAFGGIFAAEEFGMQESQVLLFGIALNIAAGLGALLLGWLDDYIGAKKVMVFSLLGLIAFGTLVLLSPNESYFWLFSMLVSLFVGPLQASSRSFLARLAPPDMRNQLFGIFTLSGKATSFLGPWVLSVIVLLTGNLRMGMGTIILFFLIGLLALIPVKEKKST